MATANEYCVVLLGRFPGKDRLVASTLARDFGRDEAWGSQVVGAAPIVILDNLSAEQAESIKAGLADIEAAGSRIEIQHGANPGIAKLSWPAPPRIKGKMISEYSAAGTHGGPSEATATLFVPCPYTGQRMKLTIAVSVTRDQVLVTGAAASAAPVLRPLPTSNVESPYKPIKTPVALPRAGTPGSSVAAPMELDLEEMDELKPMEQFRPASGIAPASVMRPSNPIAPLPDVPVLHNQPAATANTNQYVESAMPSGLTTGPMDLSAFEANVSSSGIMRAPIVPVSADPAEGDDGTLCSVSIGKSPNPKVHQIVADLLNISVEDGAKLCQKPIVTLAKDISFAQAQHIRHLLSTVHVVAKIAKRS